MQAFFHGTQERKEEVTRDPAFLAKGSVKEHTRVFARANAAGSIIYVKKQKKRAEECR